ncbi:hypothetical protein BCR42DRAFT_406201 [Absidia repens]|uniref:PH domain-containing protein n=1 Tax=Absidia repens TaxID=90262 RepID=A0A1X2IUK1_9FUNG|nr:hypothetical protein BCR42DRAFT_406201 [Absidia repens]
MLGKTAEGWLSKTGLLGTRHRRYFILSGNELRYYKQMSDTQPTGTIELKHYSIAEKDSNKQQPYAFRIASQCKYHRSYIFYADHEQGCQYWIDIINATLNPFVGRHHTCDNPVSPLLEEPYSVLDKWLNRLDLNDDRQSQSQQQQHMSRTPIIEPSSTTNTHSPTNPLASYLSPALRVSRSSTDSLDSLPSETTLSSSAGSRAHLSIGQNTIFIPHHHGNNNTTSNNNNSNSNSNSNNSLQSSVLSPPTTQCKSPTNDNLNSNPVSFVSRSLSSIKKQHSLRHNQHQTYGDNPKSPTWSFDSMTTSSTANSNITSNNQNIKTPTVFPRKDWESEGLFDFEEEMMVMNPSSLFRGSLPASSQ